MAKSIGNSVARPTHDEIAARARAIYEQKGKVPGRDVENWLEAEAQLLAVRNGNKEPGREVRSTARTVSH